MKKILFIIAFLLLSSCATGNAWWAKQDVSISMTETVTDVNGNEYECSQRYIKEGEKSTKVGKCRFQKRIGNILYECNIGVEKRDNFSFELDCAVAYTYEPEPELIVPVTVKQSKRNNFYYRTNS